MRTQPVASRWVGIAMMLSVSMIVFTGCAEPEFLTRGTVACDPPGSSDGVCIDYRDGFTIYGAGLQPGAAFVVTSPASKFEGVVAADGTFEETLGGGFSTRLPVELRSTLADGAPTSARVKPETGQDYSVLWVLYPAAGVVVFSVISVRDARRRTRLGAPRRRIIDSAGALLGWFAKAVVALVAWPVLVVLEYQKSNGNEGGHATAADVGRLSTELARHGAVVGWRWPERAYHDFVVELVEHGALSPDAHIVAAVHGTVGASWAPGPRQAIRHWLRTTDGLVVHDGSGHTLLRTGTYDLTRQGAVITAVEHDGSLVHRLECVVTTMNDDASAASIALAEQFERSAR